MAKGRSLFGEEEPVPAINEESLQKAIDMFAETNPPTPLGKRCNSHYTTDKLLREITELVGPGATPTQVHDALLEAGYRYEHGPKGYFWLVGES